MFVAHAFCNLVRGLLIDELCEQFVSVWEGGGWSLTRSDVTIDGDEVACIGGSCLFQSLLETWIAGGTLTLEVRLTM